MFLIFGISNGEKKLDFIQTMLCSRCGQYGRFEVYITYMYLSLFFIPVFRWHKRYYVKSSCCKYTYEIDPALSKKIQRGENITLKESDLHMTRQTEYSAQLNCPGCGYRITQDFAYCPKCGRRL